MRPAAAWSTPFRPVLAVMAIIGSILDLGVKMGPRPLFGKRPIGRRLVS